MHCDKASVLKVTKVCRISPVLGAPYWTDPNTFKIVKLNPKSPLHEGLVGPFNFNVGVRVMIGGEYFHEQLWTV